MIFAKNPVKSMACIWSILRNAYFTMFLAYMGAKNGLFSLCSDYIYYICLVVTLASANPSIDLQFSYGSSFHFGGEELKE